MNNSSKLHQSRIIFYYQTFNGLKDILHEDTKVTHIHLSSTHFGLNNDNSPYYLNDNQIIKFLIMYGAKLNKP